MKTLVELNCMVCGESFQGEEPRTCCSGRDCGCMGMPIDPIICSEECYYNLPHMKNRKPNPESPQKEEPLQ
jgi:hypothetical protein